MPGAPFRNRESVLGTPWLQCANNLTGESIAQRSQRRNWSGALNELLLVLLPLGVWGTRLNAKHSLLHRNQKMLPILDIMSVPNEGTDRQLSGCLWFLF
jgi:hypothetical protein